MATLPLLKELDLQNTRFMSTVDRLMSMKNSVNNEYSELQISANRRCFSNRSKNTVVSGKSATKSAAKGKLIKRNIVQINTHQMNMNKDPNENLFSVKKVKVITERINDDNYHYEGRHVNTTRRNIQNSNRPIAKRLCTSSRI